jgi:hypothetical protein
MSDQENFLARWSRRKRQAEQATDKPAKPEAGDEVATREKAAAKEEGLAAASPDASERATEPAFDPSTLPPIESITAETDIRPFLRAGVPADLTRAALRQAWLADPAIRNYIGLSENSWDFNDPTAVYGFDFSEPGAEMKKLAQEMLNQLGAPPGEKAAQVSTSEPRSGAEAAQPASQRVTDDHESVKGDAVPSAEPRGVTSRMSEREQEVTAVQTDSERASEPGQGAEHDTRAPARRRHGGALPQLTRLP